MPEDSFFPEDFMSHMLSKIENMAQKMDIETKMSRALSIEKAAEYLTAERPPFEKGDALAWIPGLKSKHAPKYAEKIIFYRWLEDHELDHACGNAECVAKYNLEDCLCIVSANPTYALFPMESRRLGKYEEMLRLTSQVMEKVGEDVQEDEED